MKTKLLIYFIFLLTLTTFAQVENSQKGSPYIFTPNFFIDVANYKGLELGNTKVDVFLQIPYSNLQFIKSGDLFKSRYSISLTFYDEDKENVIYEKLWNQQLDAKTFEEASSKQNFNYFHQSINLKPGKYVLRSEIIDKESNKNGVAEAKINVTNLYYGINLSDIIMVSGMVNDQIVPNIAKYVTSEDTSFTFFYDIYNDTSKTIKVEYIVADKNNEVIHKENEIVNSGKDRVRVFKTIKDIKFSLGEYLLTVNVLNNKDEVVKSMTKKFFSRVSGFPVSITDLDKAINQMSYIASSDDLDFIEEGENYQEKLARFKAYWKTKDPTPNTEENEVFNEYYRRVAYANEKFKQYYEGWKTDMGMVYIILGPPNNVDRHPFEYDSKPYEIWEYYTINKSFLFVDETGFGEYRLYNRAYGDWFRYRQ